MQPVPNRFQPVLIRAASLLAILMLCGQIAMLAAPNRLLETGLAAGFVLLTILGALMGLTAARITLPIMAALSLLTILGGDTLEAGVATLRQGASQAVAFITLFVALAMMREPAQRSRIVREAGAALVGQPAGRRGVALTLGTHVIGIVMHIGTLAMLGAMVRHGVGRSLTRVQLAASGGYRLCVLALLRGFSTTTCWAPTSVTAAYLAATVPGADYGRLLPVGIGFSAAAMALSWIVDAFARSPGEDPIRARADLDLNAMARLVLVIAGIVSFILCVQAGTGVTMIEAVTVAIPAACLVWIACQERGRRPFAPRLAVRLRNIARRAVPATLSETILLGAIGFISVVIAASQPTDHLGALTELLPAPTALVPLLTLMMLIGLSRLGLPPFIALVIVVALWGDTGRIGVPVELMLLAYLAGWSMAVQISISAANLLILARAVEVPVKAIIGWNRPFLLTLAAALVAVFAIRPFFGT